MGVGVGREGEGEDVVIDGKGEGVIEGSEGMGGEGEGVCLRGRGCGQG